MGILALIYDLERPPLFWRLFLTFQPNSVMSLGPWLLLFFFIFSIAHFYLWLPQKYDYFRLIPAIKASRMLNRFHGDNLTILRGLVAGFGIPISIGVGIFIPLALEVYELIPHYIKHVELRAHNPWISGIITTSVLIGGFTMRYVVIYAGQMAQVISS